MKIEQLATKFLDVTKTLKTDLANEIDSIKILLKIKSRDHAKTLMRFDAKYHNCPFPVSAEAGACTNTTFNTPDEYFNMPLPTANDVGKLVCDVLIESAPEAWQNMVTKVEPLAKQLVEGLNVIVTELSQFIAMQNKPETCQNTINALQVCKA